MKNIVSLLLVASFFVHASAQGDTINISHYVFQSFTNGTVLLKTGIKEEYLLNLNSITEQIIFRRNGIYLEIAMPQTVDTVYIQNKKFIPIDKVYYELAIASPVEFYIEYKCNLIPPGKPAGYGTTSQTGSATSVSTLAGSGTIYQLKLPDDYKISPYKKYWIKKDNVFHHANSVGQIAKIFPEKSKEIKQFAKKNKIKFSNWNDVEKLILSLQ